MQKAKGKNCKWKCTYLTGAQKNCNLKLNYRRHDIQNNDTLYNDTLPTGDSMTILIKTLLIMTLQLTL